MSPTCAVASAVLSPLTRCHCSLTSRRCWKRFSYLVVLLFLLFSSSLALISVPSHQFSMNLPPKYNMAADHSMYHVFYSVSWRFSVFECDVLFLLSIKSALFLILDFFSAGGVTMCHVISDEKNTSSTHAF